MTYHQKISISRKTAAPALGKNFFGQNFIFGLIIPPTKIPLAHN
jgi:hypothetical protein